MDQKTMTEIEDYLKEKGITKMFGHFETSDKKFFAYEFGGYTPFDRLGVGSYLYQVAKKEMDKHLYRTKAKETE
jgi:hypothetical protein